MKYLPSFTLASLIALAMFAPSPLLAQEKTLVAVPSDTGTTRVIESSVSFEENSEAERSILETSKYFTKPPITVHGLLVSEVQGELVIYWSAINHSLMSRYLSFDLQFVSKTEGAQIFTARAVSDAVISGNASVAMRVPVMKPEFLRGEYQIYLHTVEHGRNIVTSYVGTTTFSEKPYAQLSNCQLDSISLSEPNISLIFKEKNQLEHVITCQGSSVGNLAPTAEFSAVLYGRSGKQSLGMKEVTLAKKAGKISLDVTEEFLPGEYILGLFLRNANGVPISAPIEKPLVISGLGGEVVALGSDKESYAKGETMKVAVKTRVFSNTSDYILKIEAGMDGERCATSLGVRLKEQVNLFEMQIVRDCPRMTIVATLKDINGKVISTLSQEIGKEPRVPLVLMIQVFAILGFLMFAPLIIGYMKKHGRVANSVLLPFLVIIFCATLFPSTAKAGTLDGILVTDICEQSGGMNTGCNFGTPYSFDLTLTTNKDSYAPGEPMVVTASFTGSVMGPNGTYGTVAGGTMSFSVPSLGISDTITLGGGSRTYFPNAPGGAGTYTGAVNVVATGQITPIAAGCGFPPDCPYWVTTDNGVDYTLAPAGTGSLGQQLQLFTVTAAPPPTINVSYSPNPAAYSTNPSAYNVSWSTTNTDVSGVSWSCTAAGAWGGGSASGWGTSGGPLNGSTDFMGPGGGTTWCTWTATGPGGTATWGPSPFTINPALSCPLPWGGNIPHGGSVPAYQSASVVFPASCVSETRSCNNGVLSGSYLNQNCSVSAPGVCDLGCEGYMQWRVNATAMVNDLTAPPGRKLIVTGGSWPGACSGIWTQDAGSFAMPVDASCVVPTYTYTFDGAGATTPPSPGSVTGVAGSPIAPPTNPARTGYTFTNWSPAIPPTMPAGGGTSVAQWAPVLVCNPATSYGSQAACQAATGDTCYMNGTSYDWGWDYSVGNGELNPPYCLPPASPLFLQQDCPFVVTNQFLGGQSCAVATDVGKPTSWNPCGCDGSAEGWFGQYSCRAVADWRCGAPTYTITFDGNTNDGGSTAPQGGITSGATVALTGNGFTKTGYTFNDWNTAMNGSGTSYANNAPFTMPAANVTLYAQWVPVSCTLVGLANTVATGCDAPPPVGNTFPDFAACNAALMTTLGGQPNSCVPPLSCFCGAVNPPPVFTTPLSGISPVNYNTPSSLSWSAPSATQCDLYRNGALFASNVGITSGGYSTGNLIADTTFRVSCVNGTSPATQSNTITVNVRPGVNVTLWANGVPTLSGTVGETTGNYRLAMTGIYNGVSGGVSCEMRRDGTPPTFGFGSTGANPYDTGTIAPPTAGTYTWYFRCTSPTGTLSLESSPVTLNVTPPVAIPTLIDPPVGNYDCLSWFVGNSKNCPPPPSPGGIRIGNAGDPGSSYTYVAAVTGNAAVFSCVTNCSGTVNFGSTLDIGITFSPNAVGVTGGQLTITPNVGAPIVVNLVGTGVNPFPPVLHEFGRQVINRTKVTPPTLTVNNTSGLTVPAGTFTLQAGPFECQDAVTGIWGLTCAHNAIPPGNGRPVVNLRFTPSQPIVYSRNATMSVAPSATITITGNGAIGAVEFCEPGPTGACN